MEHNSLIIFVCEHGAAKSILAAAHFNRLAEASNSSLRAIARAIYPDSELSPITVAGLQGDGLLPTESAPQKLTLTEVEAAERIIAFCELPEEHQNKAAIERWDDIPPVSENYDKARAAILGHLDHLLKK
jgi:protein-tyrosine-phosphatase